MKVTETDYAPFRGFRVVRFEINLNVRGNEMFQCLKRVTYRVSDIEKAKNWYRTILDTEPTFDSPFAVVFPIGDSGLVLTPNANSPSNSDDTVVAYWGIDDIDFAYKKLLQFGAAPHTEIQSVFGTRVATVLDPFGNILGIITTNVDAKKRSVEQQPSETALGAVFLRTLASIDERGEIQGNDTIAEIFLTESQRIRLKDPAVRKWVMKNPPGMYEYLIARTAFFDDIVEQALRENIPQIVFLGAGYDSRPYRFKDLIKETSIFELDIHTTQQRKKELLHQANISLPEQLIFVSINFNKDTLSDVLFQAGYDKNQKSLFIWEGVTYYLPARVVDDTLNFIRSKSPSGSTICFDYSSRWPEMLDSFGVRELMEFMKRNHPGEPTQFGIEKGEIVSFLSDRGYKIIDHLEALDMERLYLTLRGGSSVGKVPALLCFVRAAVLD